MTTYFNLVGDLEVQSPNECQYERPIKIFLGGSIEMGKAVNWQKEVVSFIEKSFPDQTENIAVYNPRRDDWDSSWQQDPTFGTEFNNQVVWELVKLDISDIIVFVFDPNTISPITLMELGLHINDASKRKLIVCPKDYHRYGNVRLTTSIKGQNYVFFHELGEAFYEELEQTIQSIGFKKGTA